MTESDTPPATQRRLRARLVATVYAIATALFPITGVIAKRTVCPWQQRASLADRFSAILQQLLALTTRIRPATLSQNPGFPARQPAKPRAGSSIPPVPVRRPSTRPLSARQLAQRLESLLKQLEDLAAEAAAILPKTLDHLIAKARRIAGCDALPSINPFWANHAWEQAG